MKLSPKVLHAHKTMTTGIECRFHFNVKAQLSMEGAFFHPPIISANHRVKLFAMGGKSYFQRRLMTIPCKDLLPVPLLKLTVERIRVKMLKLQKDLD